MNRVTTLSLLLVLLYLGPTSASVVRDDAPHAQRPEQSLDFIAIDPEQDPECVDGTSWTEDCNSCFCFNGHAGCTLMLCDPEPIPDCVEGATWMEDCNRCWCESDGLARCTEMYCGPEPKDGYSRKLRHNTQDICRLPAVGGRCQAYIPSYYFNSKSAKCEEFIYGGCGGNANNFETKQECIETCDKSSDICRLPAVGGRCQAYIPSFYFNSKSGKCEEFIYGGCGGNANNFETKQECMETCEKSS